MPTPQIENLTELVQKHLGIEQAQTFAPEDIVADAIARLTGRRGDVSRLRRLWDTDTAHEVVADWRPAEHTEALAQLRRVLDANLVVQRDRSGFPKTFRPLVPEMVNADRPSSLYRDLGRAVTEVLWRNPDHREAIRARLTNWRTQHPLALALAPLCSPRDLEPAAAAGASRLSRVLSSGEDPGLDAWVDTIVDQDWATWLRASENLSVDEQIESMMAMICLHLHVALLWRLWGRGERAMVFVAVAGDADRACVRAAYNMYGFWGDRPYDALRRVAEDALRRAATTPGWERLETAHQLRPWATVQIDRGRSANERFRRNITDITRTDEIPDVWAAAVNALVDAFSTPSGVATKVKDYLRGTGRAVGLIGPDTYRARKRYQMDDRAIALLARLHVHRRLDDVKTREDEKMSVDALLDDVFERYGLVVTREREPIRTAFAAPAVRAIAARFPTDEAMRRNRHNLERRLDDLRLVRRYSDASAVLHVV